MTFFTREYLLVDALKYIKKTIPSAAPVTNWFSNKLFSQYNSLKKLYGSSFYLQASEFIQGQWLIEHDLNALGLNSRTAFDALCCYSVTPMERLHYLTEYYYKETKKLVAVYESFTQSLEFAWLTERQKKFIHTQVSELLHMIEAYEERLKTLAEYALPSQLISFYQSFGVEPRLLFILRLKDGVGSVALQSLPSLEDPAISGLIGHAAMLERLQQSHEQPETEPISPAGANKPPLRFVSQRNSGDKRNRSNEQFGGRW